MEVTIAMAIAAVALVTLMGLLPQGLNTMREAGDEAIMGRIHQQILNELQVADFDTLGVSYEGMEIYFDSQGEEIGNSKENASVKGTFAHIYSARISIAGPGGGKVPDSLGGGSFKSFSFDGGKSTTDLIVPVVIEVAAVAGLGGNFDWGNEEVRHLIHTYQTSVVKMGQNFR